MHERDAAEPVEARALGADGAAFTDLCEEEAARLLGRPVDDVRAMLDHGSLLSGRERGTVDGSAAFRLAQSLHARACDEAWARVKDDPAGGFDLQGRPLPDRRG